MMTTATVRVMSPEEIAARAGGETPFLQWPQRSTLFAEREMRLRQLAHAHPMREFLLFTAGVANAQQALLQKHPAVVLPDAAALDRAAQAGVPPLPAIDWPRDAAWRDGLHRIVAALRPTAPEGAHATLDALAVADAEHLERQADCLVTGVMHGLEMASAPLVAAALQVYWTHMVLEVQRRHAGAGQAFGRIDDETLCPCCGSRPTASITRLAGDTPGQRYLHCSLCSAQWHMVRIKCGHCLGTKRIAFQSLEPVGRESDGSGAAHATVQAETCEDCGHYLKIMHMDKDPQVDPVADDLASLTLDLLVSETGLQRHGVNLMLLFGAPEPGAAPPPDPGAS